MNLRTRSGSANFTRLEPASRSAGRKIRGLRRMFRPLPSSHKIPCIHCVTLQIHENLHSDILYKLMQERTFFRTSYFSFFRLLQFAVEYRSHPASDAPTSLRGRVLGWRIPFSKRNMTLKSMPIDHGRTQNWDHNHVIICGHCGYVALHQREKDTRNIGPYVIMVIISLMDHMVIELM